MTITTAFRTILTTAHLPSILIKQMQTRTDFGDACDSSFDVDTQSGADADG